MRSHFGVLLIFAFFVSTIFAVLLRDDVREQVRFGATLFGAFVLGAFVLGWLMFPFPL